MPDGIHLFIPCYHIFIIVNELFSVNQKITDLKLENEQCKPKHYIISSQKYLRNAENPCAARVSRQIVAEKERFELSRRVNDLHP
jgi:hypothetical protein